MATWERLGPDIGDIDQLQDAADSIQAAADTVAAVADLSAAALTLVSATVTDSIDFARTTLNAAADALQGTVEDFLQYNVNFAIHTNMNWDPEWTYDRFDNGGALPWVGNDTGGWLVDIAASARNPADPFRPLTDATTKVGAFIFLNGAPYGDELAPLAGIFELFTDFSDLKHFFDAKAILKDADDVVRNLTRCGECGLDDFFRRTAGGIKDSVSSAVAGFADIGPERGQTPRWIGVPMAALIPPLYEAFYLLRQAVDAFRVAESASQQIQRTIELIQRKAQQLADLAERLAAIIPLIRGALEFFANTYVLVLPPAEGGMDGLVARAQQAEGLPTFGERGIVVGGIGVTTSDEPFDHLQSLFDFVGVRFDELTTDTTVRAENLENTYDFLFLPE